MRIYRDYYSYVYKYLRLYWVSKKTPGCLGYKYVTLAIVKQITKSIQLSFTHRQT
jgi:hypothetical protein